MRFRHVLLALLPVACREAASEEPEPAREVSAGPSAPCARCTVDVPDTRRPAPLLVVLHGNHESAEDAAKRWRTAALARDWALLSLQCPEAKGCDDVGRWYRWRGEPSWVFAQVDELVRQHPIDQSRIYLAGWSGGATYIGSNMAEWHRRFAAIVIHGGGQAPANKACGPQPLPTYFLVGDKNPGHGGAKRLRNYVQDCEHVHVWDLLDGANHAAEDRALDTQKAARILDWLDDHRRAPLVSSR